MRKQPESDIDKYLEFEFIDDIVICRFLGRNVTMDFAVMAVKKRLEVTKGKDWKVLICVSNITSVPKPVRDYLSSDEAKQGIKASAIISNSPISNMIINFFLGINDISKEDFPAKVFSSEEKGLKWLKKLDV